MGKLILSLSLVLFTGCASCRTTQDQLNDAGASQVVIDLSSPADETPPIPERFEPATGKEVDAIFSFEMEIGYAVSQLMATMNSLSADASKFTPEQHGAAKVAHLGAMIALSYYLYQHLSPSGKELVQAVVTSVLMKIAEQERKKI